MNVSKTRVCCTSYEARPQCRLITVCNKMSFNGAEVVTKYYLSFPYMQFTIFETYDEFDQKICTIHKLFVTCSNEPYTEQNKKISVPCLPNICNDFSVCNLTVHPTDDPCWDAVGDFWKSKFVENDGGSYPAYSEIARCGIWNLSKWEKRTKIDPSFILKVDWPFPGRDVTKCYVNYV